MNLLRLSVSKTTLKIEKTELTVEKCVNYDRVAFTFDESWADLVRTATFWRGSKAADVYQILLDDTNECDIPWELLQKDGYIQIGVTGIGADGSLVTTQPVAQSVARGTYRDSRIPSDPTPTIYEQINQQLKNCTTRVDTLYAEAQTGRFKGDKGDKGDQGDPGKAFTYADFTPEQLAALKGEKGDKGDPGAKGDTGAAFTYEDFTAAQLAALKGDKGDKGDPGEKGAQGDKGEPGSKGDKGDPGAAGSPGAKGDKGDPFTYADFTEEQLAALKGEKGDKGDNGAQGEKGKAFTYEDFTEAQLAALKGPKGDQGDKGSQGEKGTPGAAATVVIGTVTTGEPGTDASVENAGTSAAATLNFTIPRGDKGDKGDTGSPGEKGDKGDKGDKGETGSPGAAGHSPTVTASKTGKVTTVQVDGETVATISDGLDGSPGAKGDPYTLTDADKQTITNAVLAALPTWTGGDF